MARQKTSAKRGLKPVRGLAPIRVARKLGVRFVPANLPLGEDGSLDYNKLTRLPVPECRALLREVKNALTGVPPGSFRPIGTKDINAYVLTNEGYAEFVKWNRACAVYLAHQLLTADLERRAVAASRMALPEARMKAAARRTKISPEAYAKAVLVATQESGRRGMKKHTKKMLASALNVSRQTLLAYESKLK